MSQTKKVGNLKELLCSNVERYGDANLYAWTEGKEERFMSYNGFQAEVNAVGTAFAKLGLMGGHIAVIGEAHPAYVATYYAAANGGGVIVPLDKEITDEEVANFLNISDAKAVVYTPGQNDRIIHLADRCPGVQYFIPVDATNESTECDRKLPYYDLVQMGKDALTEGNRGFVDHVVDSSKMCSILFTSGTTGTSKGVMLSHHNLAHNTMSAAKAMRNFPAGTRLMSVLPMHHTYEFTCVHMAAHIIGANIFMNDDLKYVSRNIKAWQPEVLVLVPLFVETMHRRVWDGIREKGAEGKVKKVMKITGVLNKVKIDLRKKLFAQIREAFGGKLGAIVCGAAPLAPHLITDFRAFGINILEGYGITECSPLVAVNEFGKERLKSVGTVVDYCQVKIDKEDADSGEILVKGDNVMMGYYKNPEVTAEVFTEDGWFRTGDIGHLDKDGYLFITGRKKNIIILSNGKNIYPEEIEEYLTPCELFAEVIVVGREKEGQPVITAAIYPDPEKFEGKSDEEIRTAVKDAIDEINEKLPQFKKVRNIEIRRTEFEKTTTKKIKRHKV